MNERKGIPLCWPHGGWSLDRDDVTAVREELNPLLAQSPCSFSCLPAMYAEWAGELHLLIKLHSDASSHFSVSQHLTPSCSSIFVYLFSSTWARVLKHRFVCLLGSLALHKKAPRAQHVLCAHPQVLKHSAPPVLSPSIHPDCKERAGGLCLIGCVCNGDEDVGSAQVVCFCPLRWDF